MTMDMIDHLPPRRRDRILAEILGVIEEVEAQNRSLDIFEEEIDSDDVEEEIDALLAGEFPIVTTAPESAA